MDTKKIIIGIVVVLLAFLLYKCKQTEQENMTAGLGVINGLAFNNGTQRCYPGNADQSSSPFCVNSGYVLQ